MVRRVLALVAVTAAAVALFFTATSAPAPPSPNAPRSLSLTFVQRAGRAGDELQISPQAGAWSQRARGGPLHFRFSWLECDLDGKRCSTAPGLKTRSIVPPQELRIVTLRAAITATNRFGSTTVRTSNFFYDEAGLPVKDKQDLRPFFYGPAQLRSRYALRADQDGAGETIVITARWRAPRLRAAVNRFSSHYGLPLVCGTAQAGRSCFELADHTLGHPRYVVPGEDEDIEWAHAIAPKARIVVVRAEPVTDLLRAVGREERLGDAHVVSASWAAPGRGAALYRPVAAACHVAHVVCSFPSGDSASPGDRPSNSPYVLAVGGSVFKPRPDGSLAAETRWPFSGYGGTRDTLRRPTWQRGLPACRALKTKTTSGFVLRIRSPSCDFRTVPDVSATAYGVLEYEIPAKRHRTPGWFVGGGTSLSSPLWAALIALADHELGRDGQAALGIDELHEVLYRGWVSGGLDDIGDRGWDTRTGWGSPKAGIVDALARAIERHRATR
jgi:hypothetical protein